MPGTTKRFFIAMYSAGPNSDHMVGPALLSTYYPVVEGAGNSSIERVYHHDGPTWMPLIAGEYEVLRVFRPGTQYISALLALYEQYGPEPEAPCRSAGWIAPNGAFYPCDYGNHRSTAYAITMKLWRSEGGEKELNQKRWLMLYFTGQCFMQRQRDDRHAPDDVKRRNRPTSQQVATIEALIAASPDPGWQVQLRECLEYMEDPL